MANITVRVRRGNGVGAALSPNKGEIILDRDTKSIYVTGSNGVPILQSHAQMTNAFNLSQDLVLTQGSVTSNKDKYKWYWIKNNAAAKGVFIHTKASESTTPKYKNVDGLSGSPHLIKSNTVPQTSNNVEFVEMSMMSPLYSETRALYDVYFEYHLTVLDHTTRHRKFSIVLLSSKANGTNEKVERLWRISSMVKANVSIGKLYTPLIMNKSRQYYIGFIQQPNGASQGKTKLGGVLKFVSKHRGSIPTKKRTNLF